MKKFRAILCLSMAVTMLLSVFSGCGDGDSSNAVGFWIYGQDSHIDMYQNLTDRFNETYGKEHDIKVDIALKPNGGYGSVIEMTATSKSGPDVFIVEDKDIKSWIIGDYFCPIGEYLDAVTDIDLGDISKSATSRLRYNVKTNTSSENDPLYGLPVDSQPTALYYNTIIFEKAGIKVISVDQEDLEKWNNDEIPDNVGKKKSDYGITIDVPAKGFYRETPYFVGEDSMGWSAPANNEVMIFNNRIPMNWDEYDDISMLFSATTNPSSANKSLSPYGSQYGNYTEWWYMYAWSIGGDCLTDLTNGKGEWNFSLLDPSANYIVVADSYTANSGKVYQKGETLSFNDKMDIAEEEIVIPNANGSYKHEDGSAVIIRESVKQSSQGESPALAELPSTRDAFKRYVKLTTKPTGDIEGERGLGISPLPNDLQSGKGPQNYFFSCNIAMLTATSAYTFIFEEQAQKRTDFDFDVAPLPVYKEYVDPRNPDCDEVKVAGKTQVGHASAYSLVIRTRSEKKEKAAAFVKWMAGLDAQEYRASMGYFPNQSSLISKFKTNEQSKDKNFKVFAEAVSYQTPGDWWYMPDYSWIEQWSEKLNNKVRNGTMSFTKWVEECLTKTNDKLKEYKGLV